MYTLGQLYGINRMSIKLFKPTKMIQRIWALSITLTILIFKKKTLYNIYTTFSSHHMQVLNICYVLEAKTDLEIISMTKTYSLVTQSCEYIAVVLREGFWMFVGTFLVAIMIRRCFQHLVGRDSRCWTFYRSKNTPHMKKCPISHMISQSLTRHSCGENIYDIIWVNVY